MPRIYLKSKNPISQPQNLIGQKFGRWTVIGSVQKRQRFIKGKPKGFDSYWPCECECGNQDFKLQGNLIKGLSKSCGCLKSEVTSARTKTHGQSFHRTPEYRAWHHMLDRCLNPSDSAYSNYGGRGIKVCEEWLSFEAFFAYIGKRPGPKHSLDRIDVNGNYEPGNVRWATKTEQVDNRRITKKVTFNGETLPITEWARRLGFTYHQLFNRLYRHNWPIERALTTPRMQNQFN